MKAFIKLFTTHVVVVLSSESFFVEDCLNALKVARELLTINNMTLLERFKRYRQCINLLPAFTSYFPTALVEQGISGPVTRSNGNEERNY